MSFTSRSRRKISQQGRKSSRSSMGIWLIGAAILFVILIVVAINVSNSQPVGELTQPDVPAEWINRNSIGNPDATVVVEAYEDFLCSHCLEWTNSVKPQLMENYIKPGKVRFVFQNFPLSGFLPGSNMAALASQCAADQGAFWPYHDRLFNAQRNGQPAFTFDSLVGYAKEMSLNEREFTSCMSSLTHQSAVDSSVQGGISKGVQGTPALFVNGNSVTSDYNSLQTEIDRLLNAAG
jgi:protein-disulfide isomerase